MILRASIRFNGHQYNGDPEENHPDIMKAHDIGPDLKHQRGFVTQSGQFLSRNDAKLYLASKDKALYKAWVDVVGGEGEELHSEDLFDAMEAMKPEKKTDTSKDKVLIIDLGLFTETAVRIARDVGECWYYIPHEDAFPEPFQVKIGEGLEGVERIESPYADPFGATLKRYMAAADFIFCPDMMFAGMVEAGKADGLPIGGPGAAERLERDRWYARGVQEKAGLPVQETYRVKGITNLRLFTKEHKNFWVKIDVFRGLEETFFFYRRERCRTDC